jgi:Zn-dependent peptidase ImmA (M78 family)
MTIDRTAYYSQIRELALVKRAQFSVVTGAFGLAEVRAIYRSEGIAIDSRKLTPRLKAIYMCSDGDCSVAIRKDLPKEPKLFALVHELKHHWADRALMEAGHLSCGSFNENELFEKAAEVFAAEFIYPETELRSDFDVFEEANRIKNWTADNVIHFKRNQCRANVSYTYLRKRLEWFGKTKSDQFHGVQFQKREDELYGAPVFRQPWFVARRKARSSSPP